MKLFPSLSGILFLALCIIAMTGCEKEEVACATWDGEVKTIIESTCSYSGCHSGGTTANPYLSPGSNDFTTYAGIKSNLDNGNFEKRALIDKNMPNAMFVPAGNPTELTTAQLDILQCWADAGFPEN